MFYGDKLGVKTLNQEAAESAVNCKNLSPVARLNSAYHKVSPADFQNLASHAFVNLISLNVPSQFWKIWKGILLRQKKTLVQAKTTLSGAFQVKQFCLVRFLPAFTLDSTNSMDFRSPDLQISAIARCISSSQPTGVCPTWIILGYVRLKCLIVKLHHLQRSSPTGV